jgi:hypothetical protein
VAPVLEIDAAPPQGLQKTESRRNCEDVFEAFVACPGGEDVADDRAFLTSLKVGSPFVALAASSFSKIREKSPLSIPIPQPRRLLLPD